MKIASILLAVGAILTASPVFSAELTILTENLPPLNYLDNGRLVGPSVEIVKEIQRRVGSREKIQVYPWARAYQQVLEEENVVLFGMTQTAARQDQFKWVGPLATKRDILVARRQSGITIDSLADAMKVKRIGTLRGDTREQFLLDHGFSNLDSVSDEQKNARKLILSRIDLWAYKQPGLKTVCTLAGVSYDDVVEVYHLREIDVSIAFSKRTPDAIVEQWRKAFGELQADGTIQRIRHKWDVE